MAMGRRVPVQQLRGSDPTLLEVQIQDMLGKPIGQIAPDNLMDLLALSEVDGLKASLKRQLDGFRDRVGQEVADLPDGEGWDAYLTELGTLSADRIPMCFREIIKGQTERDARRDSANAILETWTGTEPTPFELGSAPPPVQKAEAAPAPKKTRAAAKKRTVKPKVVADPARRAFIVSAATETLARTSENGLLEAVLIAGIRHRAKPDFPDMTVPEITKVLKELKENGQLRYSANRWSAPGRW